jgi:14-3-3 family protein
MSLWIAPTGTKLASDDWTEIGATPIWDGLVIDKAAERCAEMNEAMKTLATAATEVTLTFRTLTFNRRLLFGLSRKQDRILRGIEKKQLLHKGGKP